MRMSKERPSKSYNAHSFRISKVSNKMIPPSPVNGSERESKSKYLRLEIPKVSEPYFSRSEHHESRSVLSSQNGVEEKDVDQASVKNLISILMSKGPKFKETISAYGEQISNWILESESLSIKTHNIFQKLVDQRRLGVDLKGLNSTLIAEIERGLMSTLSFEARMYEKEKEFKQYKTQISDSLRDYKAELLKQIELIDKE